MTFNCYFNNGKLTFYIQSYRIVLVRLWDVTVCTCLWRLWLGFQQGMSLMCLETQCMSGRVSTQGASHFIPLQIFPGILNEEERPCSYQITSWKQITVICHPITIWYCIFFFFFLDDLCLCPLCPCQLFITACFSQQGRCENTRHRLNFSFQPILLPLSFGIITIHGAFPFPVICSVCTATSLCLPQPKFH